MNYSFEEQESCKMCMAPTSESTILGSRLNRTTGFRPRTARGVSVTVERCSQCGLVYSNPQPRPKSLSQHYDVPPETYWQDGAFDYDEKYFSQEIAVAKRLLGDKTGLTALDIGTGLGKGMKSLQRAGFVVTGIEPSESFRNRALEIFGFDPATLQLASAETAEFELNSFDFITFGAVLEHLTDPGSALTRALHWLKPGGVLQAEVPSSDWLLSRAINVYYKMMGTTFVTNLSPMHPPYHLYEFTLRCFQEFAARVGCEIAHHDYYVCDPMKVPKLLQPLATSLMDRTNTGMQLCVWLRKPV